MSANLKELYSSANGDVWFLERVPDGLFGRPTTACVGLGSASLQAGRECSIYEGDRRPACHLLLPQSLDCLEISTTHQRRGAGRHLDPWAGCAVCPRRSRSALRASCWRIRGREAGAAAAGSGDAQGHRATARPYAETVAYRARRKSRGRVGSVVGKFPAWTKI